jgi:putative photosynthetic complex assembly protein 2
MLWLMHLSARLNVFLGARNVSAEFVPDHMDVLKGFMRQRNMNALFPISCLAIILLVAFLMSMPQTPGVVMAETLAAIGLLEHVLLMLPLPVDKLWRWSLAGPSSRGGDQPRANPNHPHSKTDLRFLGS